MNRIDLRRYEMLVRVRDFGDSHGHLFPESSLARQTFTAIAAAVRQLDLQRLQEEAASVIARAHRKDAARRALGDRLTKIVQTARVLANDVPGLEQTFELPAKVTDQTLLAAARRFHEAAAPHNAQFVSHGMPATFLADTNGLADALEAALRERGMSRDEQVGARERIKTTLAEALAAVRKLDVIVTNHFGDDAVTQAVWRRDRRVLYPSRPPKEAAPAQGEPAPTPSADVAA
jgi:hypothetical protein